MLGFSLGGIAALHAAALAPERVRGLALLDATVLPVPAAQRAARRARVAEAQQLSSRTFVEQHRRQCRAPDRALEGRDTSGLTACLLAMGRFRGYSFDTSSRSRGRCCPQPESQKRSFLWISPETPLRGCDG